MPKKFHKLFLDSSIAFRDLSWSAREVWVFLHSLEVESDGTVAHLKPGEKPCQAIGRTHGVPVGDRRRYRTIVPELIEGGFLFVHDDRVMLANWQARQAWFRGELAPPFHDANSTRTERELDANSTRTERELDANRARTGHEPGAKEPESFKADSESTPSQRGSGSGSGLREGRNKTARGEQSEEELESELGSHSENGRAETPRPQVAVAEPPPARARSAAPQGSEQWCREELDLHNPFDVELFEKGASR